MTYRVIFTPAAERDLDVLFEYVAKNSGLDRAHGLIGRIRDSCLGFDTTPHRGIGRDDIREEMRVVGFRRWASIVFRIKDQDVIVLRIYYRGRDYAADFRDEDL